LLQTQYYAGVDAGDKTIDDKWSVAKKKLYLAYPMLESRLQGNLSDGTSPNKSDHRSDIEDIRTAISWMKDNGKANDRVKNAEGLIALYDQANAELTGINPQDPMLEKSRNQLKEKWNKVVDSWSGVYEDDIQWKLLLNATTGALGF
jgi:hypothetical protein